MTAKRAKKAKELKPITLGEAKEMLRSAMAYLSVSGFGVKYGMVGEILVIRVTGLNLNEDAIVVSEDAIKVEPPETSLASTNVP